MKVELESYAELFEGSGREENKLLQ
jgi:hypothetical protein